MSHWPMYEIRSRRIIRRISIWYIVCVCNSFRCRDALINLDMCVSGIRFHTFPVPYFNRFLIINQLRPFKLDDINNFNGTFNIFAISSNPSIISPEIWYAVDSIVK